MELGYGKDQFPGRIRRPGGGRRPKTITQPANSGGIARGCWMRWPSWCSWPRAAAQKRRCCGSDGASVAWPAPWPSAASRPARSWSDGCCAAWDSACRPKARPAGHPPSGPQRAVRTHQRPGASVRSRRPTRHLGRYQEEGVGQPEGEGCRSFAHESDGTLFRFVVLDCKVDRARATGAVYQRPRVHDAGSSLLRSSHQACVPSISARPACPVTCSSSPDGLAGRVSPRQATCWSGRISANRAR